jgi:hypothetical protein
LKEVKKKSLKMKICLRNYFVSSGGQKIKKNLFFKSIATDVRIFGNTEITRYSVDFEDIGYLFMYLLLWYCGLNSGPCTC